ncbi:MAG: hypothetical protein ACOCZ7_03780 [Armatimonadota bacterium]
MRVLGSFIVAILVLMAGPGVCQQSEESPVTSIEQNQHGEWILLRDGQPWFRLGYFMPPNYSAEQLEDMAQRLADAGLNHMHARPMGVSEEEFAQWLSRAQDLGIDIAYSLHDIEPDAVRDILNTWAGHRAIGCWYLDDVHAFSPEQLQALYDQIRVLDPARTTDWSGGWRTDLATYLPTCDVFHRQFYPIWETEGGRNHERMYDTYDEAKKLVSVASETRTVPGMDLQGAYSNSGRDFWPTAEETDVMFYMSVIAGVKGVRWYPFGEVEGTGFWQQSQVIARELNSGLSEAFLLGERTDGAISHHVFYGTWQHKGDVYVVVCNAHDERSDALTVPLPGPVAKIDSLFDYRTSSLTLTEAGLVGSLPPLTVEIYRGNADR